MKVSAVLFDFIGTTVIENIPNTIARCFEQTFKKFGMQMPTGFIEANRGKNKREVFLLATTLLEAESSRVAQMLKAFEINIEENLSNFSAATDAVKTFRQLREKGIKIGIGTGLTRESFDQIIFHLKWSKADFEYTATAEEIGKGRPHPDMIFDMMRKLNIIDPKQILKVGDTVSDIQEGKNAGVWTAAILSGAQSREGLLEARPDFVFNTLSDVIRVTE